MLMVVQPEFKVALPSARLPLKKVIVPVGVPAAEVLLAVKMMVAPNPVEALDEVTTVVVAALLTSCTSVVELLGEKLPSPL